MFRYFLRWLDSAPIADPVDRRNARVIQALLLFMGITIPMTVGFALFVTWESLASAEAPWSVLASLTMSLGIAAASWTSFYLVRRGSFRPAVRLLIGVLLGVTALNLAANGLQRQITDQLAQMLILMLSGLVLGRRSLWIALTALVAATIAGAIRDAIGPLAESPARAFFNLPPVIFSYLLVGVLIDRTTEALRESLRESNARGERLAQEMREREKVHSQLIHAQKRDITERMASGMAHDFNNIFAVITGFANLRHDDESRSTSERVDDLQDALTSVEESARRGMAISRKLLRFSRRDEDSPERFNAQDAIDALEPMLRQLLAPGIKLRIDRSGTAVPIYMDRSQFELVLLNVASNAADALGQSGCFSIAAEMRTAQVIIALKDDGPGMEPEVSSRVFEPFFSTKPADLGTGLGLAVVREIVERAGGSVCVNSAPGSGTCLYIKLPSVP